MNTPPIRVVLYTDSKTCAFCKVFKPVFDGFVKLYKIPCVVVDLAVANGEEFALCRKRKVQALPTTLFLGFHDRILGSVAGAVPGFTLQAAYEAAVKKASRKPGKTKKAKVVRK